MRKPIQANFFRTDAGHEPVRSWLRKLTREQRKAIGDDIRTLQFQWPIGMPKVRKLEDSLWEVRTRLDAGAARVLFTLYDDRIVLLHGFLKQSAKIPANEFRTAKRRLSQLRS